MRNERPSEKPVRPRPLVKFAEPRWVDSFFADGSLRIGTLKDFRDIEAHGRERGDRLEGIIRRGIMINSVDDLYEHDGFIRGRFTDLPSDRSEFSECIISDNLFVEKEVVEQLAVFCMSNSARRETACKFGGQGFEIKYRRLFMYALTDQLRKVAPDVRFLGYNFVTYGDRVLDYRSPFQSAVYLKPESYKDQFEVRAVWRIKGTQSEYFIRSPEAASYCRRLDVSRLPTLIDWPVETTLQPASSKITLGAFHSSLLADDR